MIDLPTNYARVLFDMNIEAEQVEDMRALLTESPELKEALTNPLVRKAEKRNVIDKLFPQSVRSFVKVMSDNDDIECADEMLEAYDAMVRESKSTVKAVFTYVTKPDDAQIEQLKKSGDVENLLHGSWSHMEARDEDEWLEHLEISEK